MKSKTFSFDEKFCCSLTSTFHKVFPSFLREFEIIKGLPRTCPLWEVPVLDFKTEISASRSAVRAVSSEVHKTELREVVSRGRLTVI